MLSIARDDPGRGQIRLRRQRGSRRIESEIFYRLRKEKIHLLYSAWWIERSRVAIYRVSILKGFFNQNGNIIGRLSGRDIDCQLDNEADTGEQKL